MKVLNHFVFSEVKDLPRAAELRKETMARLAKLLRQEEPCSNETRQHGSRSTPCSLPVTRPNQETTYQGTYLPTGLKPEQFTRASSVSAKPAIVAATAIPTDTRLRPMHVLDVSNRSGIAIPVAGPAQIVNAVHCQTAMYPVHPDNARQEMHQIIQHDRKRRRDALADIDHGKQIPKRARDLPQSWLTKERMCLPLQSKGSTNNASIPPFEMHIEQHTNLSSGTRSYHIASGSSTPLSDVTNYARRVTDVSHRASSRKSQMPPVGVTPRISTASTGAEAPLLRRAIKNRQQTTVQQFRTTSQTSSEGMSKSKGKRVRKTSGAPQV